MKNRIFLLVLLLSLSLKNNAQTIIDIDGNIYNTITIGTQTWMQENLKTTRFNNGLEIPSTSLPINNDTTVLYQWPYNDDTINVDKYGLLYTWNIVTHHENVCPNGWHVPNNAEWETLRDFLGGESIAGAKMKEMGTVHWIETDSIVDNSSGFTGLGSGFRGNPSGFKQLGELGAFWSSTPFGTIGAFPRGHKFSLAANNNSFLISVAVANTGKAIRCLKDETTSSINNSSLKSEIQIFPNPASDRISISFEQQRSYHLFIYDILGNKLHTQKVVDKVNDVDIAFLPKGTYLIQIIADDHITLHKFIKQ